MKVEFDPKKTIERLAKTTLWMMRAGSDHPPREPMTDREIRLRCEESLDHPESGPIARKVLELMDEEPDALDVEEWLAR